MRWSLAVVALTVGFWVLMMFAGCGDPLRTAFSLGVAARKAADIACKPVVAACVARKDATCAPLKVCQAKRDALYPLLERYQSGVAGLVEARTQLEALRVRP